LGGDTANFGAFVRVATFSARPQTRPKQSLQRELGRGAFPKLVSSITGNLTLKSIQKEDHGRYECIIQNEVATLVTTSLLEMLLILLHKGRGGGLSDMFGGGVSSGLGGSSVAERNLDRITIGIGLIWFACIVALGLLLKPA